MPSFFFRFRFIIPVIIFSVSAMLIFYLTLESISEEKKEAVEAAMETANTEMTQLQQIVSSSLLKGDTVSVEQYLAFASLAPMMTKLILTDENHRILFANRREWQTSDPASISGYNKTIAEQTTKLHKNDLSNIPTNLLQGYYPVNIGIRKGEIRAIHIGTLYAEYDLSEQINHHIHDAYKGAIRLGGTLFICALILSYSLHLLITKPIGRLISSLNEFAAGNLNARAEVSGKSEINQLVVTFNEMAEKLAENQKHLLEQNEQLEKSRLFQAETERIGNVGGWEFNIETQKMTWSNEVYRIHELDESCMPTVAEGINFYTEESRPIIKTAVKRAMDNHEPFDVELEIITAKGNLKHVHAIGRVDQANNRIIGFFQDISGRKKAEAESRSLEKRLYQAQKMESLGVMAGGIAHDFNNILTTITCCCSLGILKPEMAGKLFSDIETDAMRAAVLCRQMLAYAGKTQFIKSKVNVKTLLDDAISLVRASLPKKVTIIPRLSGDIPTIDSDADQLRQIFINLLSNASEAIGEEEGIIRINLSQTALKADPPEKDYAGQEIKAGDYICLEITDNGCGMDEETLQRIFDPFFSTKFVGRGLGLPAVLGAVTSQNGALQLRSKPEEGTTVKIYLPHLEP